MSDLDNSSAFQPDAPFTFEDYKIFVEQHDRLIARAKYTYPRDFSPEYVKLRSRIYFGLPPIYRSKLPVYLLARCPLCGSPVSESVDTFSLAGVGWWLNGPDGFGWFGRSPQVGAYTLRCPEPSYQARCDHVRALVYGVNLNGIFPDDARPRTYVVIGSERPGVLRPFMEQADSYAVIHTLPVGRLDDEEWRPRYTVYFVTYFSADVTAYRRSLTQDPLASGFCWPYDLLDYDLSPWLRAGKLFWLGAEAEDYPLLQEPVAEFPYGNLDGLTGRWAIYGLEMRLLPNEMTVGELMHSSPKRQVAFQRLKPIQEEALKKRGPRRLH